MPLSQDEFKRIVRDPRIQEHSDKPEVQVRILQGILQEAYPGFADEPIEQQLNTAAQVFDAHNPGFLSRVADVLPIVGPIKQAVEDPARVRPLTRGALEALGAGGLLDTPVGRGVAEGARELIEGAALTVAGIPLAKAITPALSRVLPAGASALAAQIPGRVAAGGVEEAAALAAKAQIAKYVDRAIVDGTIGSLYGLVNVLETGEFRPVEQFVLPVAAAAGLHALFAGAGNARARYGEYRTREGLAALQADPVARQTAAELQPIVAAYGKAARVDPVSAAETILTAARGELLEPDQFGLLRETLVRQPELLRSNAGLQLLRSQREHMLPRVIEEAVPEGQLRIQVQLPNGTNHTLIDPPPSELRRLAAGHAAGDLHVFGASGHGSQQIVQRLRLAIEESHGGNVPDAPLGGQGVLSPADEALSSQGPFRRGTLPEPRNPREALEFELRAQGQLQPQPVTATEELSTGLGAVRRGAVPDPHSTEAAVFQDLAAQGRLEGPPSAATGALNDQAVQQILTQLGPDAPRQILLEQIDSVLPAALRNLELKATPVPDTPLRTAREIAGLPPARPNLVNVRPERAIELPITSLEQGQGALRQSLVGRTPRQSQLLPTAGLDESSALLKLVRDVGAEGKTLSTARLQKELGIPFSEAQETRRRLVESGFLDRKGKPTAPRPAPAEPAVPTALPEPGAPIQIPGSGEPGQVITATPAQTIVRTSNGEVKALTELADGGHAELVKEPGLPVEATTPERQARRRSETKGKLVRDMTPEEQQARIAQLEKEMGKRRLPNARLTEYAALKQMETEGRLSAGFYSVRCKP